MVGNDNQEVIEEELLREEADETEEDVRDKVTAKHQPGEKELEHAINATAEDLEPADQEGWKDDDLW